MCDQIRISAPNPDLEQSHLSARRRIHQMNFGGPIRTPEKIQLRSSPHLESCGIYVTQRQMPTSHPAVRWLNVFVPGKVGRTFFLHWRERRYRSVLAESIRSTQRRGLPRSNDVYQVARPRFKQEAVAVLHAAFRALSRL